MLAQVDMSNSSKEHAVITIERVISIYNKGTYITDSRRGSIYIPDNEFDEFKKQINNIKIQKNRSFNSDKKKEEIH